MAASTPVSAYLHSATMVKAGVYLVARFAPLFAAVALWRPAVFVVGGVSLLAGALQALRQFDLKLLLAYGTISQLGLMVVLFGAGTPAVSAAAWELLVAHAVFKAALFMVVGHVEHQTGTRDVRELPGLERPWWWVKAIAAIGALAMAGVPIGLAFVAKEAAYESLADARFGGAVVVLAVAVIGSALTAAYAARFYFGAFGAPSRWAGHAVQRAVPPPSWSFGAPAVALALTSVVLGVAPAVLDELATASVQSLGPPGFATYDVHLALWHGVNAPFALSLVALGGGFVVFLANQWLFRLFHPRAWMPNANRAFVGTLRGLRVVSARVTGTVQSGSLPVYAGVVLLTAALLPTTVLLSSWDGYHWPAVIGTIANVPIATMLVVAAVGAAAVRRRFSAAVFLGVAGYAMAGLFVVYGAPDLALTQAAIETLSTVLFVLVLRRLPDRFERQSSARRRVVRIGIASAVGVAVFAFAIAAASSRSEPRVSDEMVARSVPDGEGRNVVNVILVDFRGLDTLGEITVLAVASIGAVALARVGRRAVEQRGAPRTGSREGMTRIVFVDVSAQVVFYAIVMGSLWLLFAGHNQPGGGFVGGLLAGSAIALRYIAGGIDEVRALSRFRPWTVLGTGLLVAATVAALPLLSGDAVLEHVARAFSVPVFGAAKVSSALVFDVGVYVTVVGLVLMVFEAFGDEPADVPADRSSDLLATVPGGGR
jgi:multicomponent Na+:H+ antiporter subunit A